MVVRSPELVCIWEGSVGGFAGRTPTGSEEADEASGSVELSLWWCVKKLTTTAGVQKSGE